MEYTTNNVTRQLVLNAKTEDVWDALINPEKTKLFFFNAEVESEWLKGSPIQWVGVNKKKGFLAKGGVIVFEKYKQLKHTYIELHKGTEDISTNYLHVTYFLERKYNGTELEINIDSFNDDNNRCAFIAKMWDSVVIPGLKRMFPVKED